MDAGVGAVWPGMAQVADNPPGPKRRRGAGGGGRRDRYRRDRARRLLSAALVVIAAWLIVGMVRPAAPPTVEVLVAAHALPAGSALTTETTRLVQLPSEAAPEGALSALPQDGHLAGESNAGEVLTTARLRRLDGAGPGAATVFVPLTDPGLVQVLAPGARVDLVDVVQAQVLAHDVLVSAVSATLESGERPGIFVTLPRDRAPAVAVAAGAMGGGVAVVLTDSE